MKNFLGIKYGLHKGIIIFILLSNSTLIFGQSLSDIDKKKIKNLLIQQVDHNNVASISIAVINKGKVILEESYGYANKERKIVATIHTPYYLASVTKSITATAILQLAEKGKISLHDPVNKYLTHYKVTSKFWNIDSVTIRKTLGHTAGFTTHDRDCYPDKMTCPITMATTFSRYANVIWKPGSKFDYSNIGYQVLGEIIKEQSKMSLAKYFEKEIFSPLKMKNSFLAETAIPANTALRYRGGPPFSAAELKISNTPASSSAYSSVNDLTKFALLHLGYIDREILSLKTIKLKETSLNNDFGWSVNQDYFGFKSFYAQGGTTDAQASIRLIPTEGIAVIVLANSGHADCNTITNKILSVLNKNFEENFEKQTKTTSSTLNNPGELFSEDLKGEWGGEIETFNGNVPVKLCIQCNSENKIEIDNDIKVTSINYKNGVVSFNLIHKIPIDEDMGNEPYSLRFYLSQKENTLYGVVSTMNIDYNNAPRLSYIVKLKKAE
ncbi:serine hydrolase [Emticicia sp. BO119]|uniref:serine hydrolase domain-containing protein n=1 Tax=Emticicia sp. BO119 TaxID=2757768 RepID=UPI0015F0D6B4|nr:serine hydrolase domain-containing protein [Emticicia sp. BO119]MBA4851721.1 beta-lactamase family protein [Emticicia sp. BO119]